MRALTGPSAVALVLGFELVCTWGEQVKGEAEQVKDALRQISELVRVHMQRKPSQVSNPVCTETLAALPRPDCSVPILGSPHLMSVKYCASQHFSESMLTHQVTGGCVCAYEQGSPTSISITAVATGAMHRAPPPPGLAWDGGGGHSHHAAFPPPGLGDRHAPPVPSQGAALHPDCLLPHMPTEVELTVPGVAQACTAPAQPNILDRVTLHA